MKSVVSVISSKTALVDHWTSLSKSPTGNGDLCVLSRSNTRVTIVDFEVASSCTMIITSKYLHGVYIEIGIILTNVASENVYNQASTDTYFS